MRSLLCFLLLIYELGSALTKLPDDFPETSEVSTLLNDVIFCSSIKNGTTEKRFNLHILKLDNYQIAMKDDYSTNEIRFDDTSSRANLRCTLNHGEYVNRVIHEESWSKPFLTYTDNDKQIKLVLFELVNNESTSGHETEWDEYRYFFNGYTENFFVENNGSGESDIQNNLNLRKNGCNKSLKECEKITTDGVKNNFKFTTKENRRHRNVQIFGNIPFVTDDKCTVTACFLNQIVSADS
jgi:hypothetical protein